ncbi:hypothetical protein RDMS_01400 [Deinococcus sp. RL]|uniref:hypothetical protein n=1 Tax=Deinococcus sp. RL TaxID=1489678 RepID=UPI0004DB0135|nr:hypothetical protein [Deinococcus sp. RL]KEF35559.1 hypothetical protein RDMS_01400 [Deinococcus sp. RL]
MTRPDAQDSSPAPSAPEVEYLRKLSLAILSTLQAKGVLSADEVDAVLIAARRAAQGVPATSTPASPLPAPQTPALKVTVQPAPPLTFHAHARTPRPDPEAPPADVPDAAAQAPTPPQDDAPVPSPIVIGPEDAEATEQAGAEAGEAQARASETPPATVPTFDLKLE